MARAYMTRTTQEGGQCQRARSADCYTYLSQIRRCWCKRTPCRKPRMPGHKKPKTERKGKVWSGRNTIIHFQPIQLRIGPHKIIPGSKPDCKHGIHAKPAKRFITSTFCKLILTGLFFELPLLTTHRALVMNVLGIKPFHNTMNMEAVRALAPNWNVDT